MTDPQVAIRPVPTDEEAAAIVAAIELGLPSGSTEAGGRLAVPRWRFSGRWWTRPVPLRRTRPSG